MGTQVHWPNLLTSLSYKNFKAFAHLELETRPITVLLGPNNSGKSSILAGPKLLSQTMESFDRNVTLLLNGIFGDYGTYKDVVHEGQRSRPFELKLSLRYASGWDPLRPERPSAATKRTSLRLKYRYRSRLKQIVLAEIEMWSGSRHVLKTVYSQGLERQLIHLLGNTRIPKQSSSSISRRLRLQHFLPQGLGIPYGADGQLKTKPELSDVEIRAISQCGRAFYRFLDDVEYVGAIRAAPSRVFLFSGETRARVGPSGEHAINMLMMDALKAEPKRRRIHHDVIRFLRRSGIAADLKIMSLSDRHFEIHVKHPKTKEYSNFADVGYGTSQLLPVLVAGYNLRPGGTLLVEQPELHLHPKAQGELGDFFCELYERRVQSIVETHSEHLVLRLQSHVASGRVRADQIIFYYVHAKQGRKRATKMELDSDGRFRNDWPEGFFPERLEEARKLAKARYKPQ